MRTKIVTPTVLNFFTFADALLNLGQDKVDLVE